MTYAVDAPLGAALEDKDESSVVAIAPPFPEPHVKKYPGWVTMLILVGGSAALWTLLYAGYRALGGHQLPFLF